MNLIPEAQTQNNTLPEGYTVRAATMGDIEAAVTMFNACSMAINGTEERTVNDTRLFWTNPEFNLDDSTRVVHTAQGQLVGYIDVWDNRKPPVHPVLWGRVHPDHMGKGIGSYLMQWGEKRARTVFPRCPSEARIAAHVDCHTGHTASEQLLENLGYSAIRHFFNMAIEMDSAPPAAQFPEGIGIRHYRHPEELAAVVLAARDIFRDHWGFIDTPLEDRVRQWTHRIERDEEFDASTWFLAVDETSGEIAGISLCRRQGYDEPDMAWVDQLGVRRAYRKQGLGLALLYHTFGEFWKRSQPKVGLGVDASSLTGATRLYEKGGMHVHKQFTVYEKELRPGTELSTTSVTS